MKYLFYNILLIGACLVACQHKETPNPCAGITETSAEFITYEDQRAVPAMARIADQDTFVSPTFIVLEAKDTTAEKYEWKIGSDERVFTKRKFQFNFASVTEGVINIQLKVTKHKSLYNCFADDDSIKISNKLIHVLEWHKNFFLGSWTGYLLSNPNKELEVLFKEPYQPGDPNYYGYEIELFGGLNCERSQNEGLTDFQMIEVSTYNFYTLSSNYAKYCNPNNIPNYWYGYLNHSHDTLNLIKHPNQKLEQILDKFIATRKK